MTYSRLVPRIAKLILILGLSTSTSVFAGDTCGLDLPEHPRRLAVRLTNPAVELSGQVLGNFAVQIKSHNPNDPVLKVLEYPEAMTQAERHERVNSLASLPTVEFAAPVHVGTSGGLVISRNELMLRFEPDVSRDQQLAVLQATPDCSVLVESFGNMNHVWRLRFHGNTGAQLFARIDDLAQQPGVLWVEPYRDIAVRTSDCTAPDCKYTDQWALRNTGQFGGTAGIDLNAGSTWCFDWGDSDVQVVVIDSGIQMDHPDLNLSDGRNFYNLNWPDQGGPVGQCEKHGTAVAGVISGLRANTGYTVGCPSGQGGGIVGVAPGCKVASARATYVPCPFPCDPFCASGCSGTCPEFGGTNPAEYVAALDWSVAIGARITVASLEFVTFSQVVSDKYDETLAAGVMHFAALGNSGSTIVKFPATSDSVIAVSAINSQGNRPSWSTYGAFNELTAPGVGIWTTDRTGSPGYGSLDHALKEGTSFAAPYAAGVAALIFSAAPELTPAEAESILFTTSIDQVGTDSNDTVGWDFYYGWGLPDLSAALRGTGNAYAWSTQPSGGDGSPESPFDKVQDAANNVTSGKRLIMRAGNYDEVLTISTPMELHSAMGAAVIGE